MTTLQFDRRQDMKDLEAFNIERVRSYLERNLGCTRKEVMRALRLSSHTVAKAVKVIRGQQ